MSNVYEIKVITLLYRLSAVDVFPGRMSSSCSLVDDMSTCGHKSHIGQKKCFTPKYREKCTYFVLTEQTIYYEHLTHIKVYIFWKLTFDTHKSIHFLKTHSPKIPLVPCVPKPNDTGCANYAGWNITIIMHFVKWGNKLYPNL